MITAKLIKSLEQDGFALDFPKYESNDERIIEILKTNNERLSLSLPLILRYEFNYHKIIKKLTKAQIQLFNKSIILSNNIFKKEHIENTSLINIIKENDLKQKISKIELEYYHSSFKAFLKNKEHKEEQHTTKQINLRTTLNLNQSLAKLYSPAKIRIMQKIFNHEQLTNTELKYYYRSIRPLIIAILNENLQKYIRIVETTKKYM